MARKWALEVTKHVFDLLFTYMRAKANLGYTEPEKNHAFDKNLRNIDFTGLRACWGVQNVCPGSLEGV